MPTEVGFYYGTSSGSMNVKVISDNYISDTADDFYVDLSGLTPGQKYFYQAFVKVCGSGVYLSDYEEIRSVSSTFTTPVPAEQPALGKGWLEMPADERTDDSDNFVSFFEVSSDRNYSYLFDKSMYTTMWTAYPVYNSVMGGNYSASWKRNPNLSEAEQINIWSGSYGVEDYSRGHLLPDASRDGDSEMIKQAYYATNQVPQIQTSFNGGVWSRLEEGIRGSVTSTCDTVYVVTGVEFAKVGETKSIKYISPKCDTKQCPVPNYFYKVALKVRRSGDTIVSASAVGFWFEHKTYSDSYTNYAVSVDQIEEWTGMDFFVNLPDSVEDSAERNSSWSDFQSF